MQDSLGSNPLKSLSLRARLTLVVFAVALVPLILVGWWLTGATATAGTRLLRERLRATAERAADEISMEWSRESAVLYDLIDLPEVRRALSGASVDRTLDAECAAVLSRHGAVIAGVVLHDLSGKVLWTFRPDSEFEPGANAPAGKIVRVEIAIHSAMGELEGSLHADLFVNALVATALGAARTAGAILGVIDARTGQSLVPVAFDADQLRKSRFVWIGEEWMTNRRAVAQPPLEIVTAASLTPFTLPFRSAARDGLVVLLITGAAGLVATLLLTRPMTVGLERLALAADRLGAGDLGPRVEMHGGGEIERVARAFNAMAENLGDTLAQLSQRESLAAVGQFASELAHEVRNPLTAIRVDLQLVEESLPADSRLRTMQRAAIADLDALEATVSGVLQLARSGKLTLVRVDMREPATAASRRAQEKFASRGAHLHIWLPDAPVIIHGDNDALRQAFLNLLLNAAQACAPGGRCDFTIATDGTTAVATVRDDGEGMTPETLKRALEPFYSTHSAGTGLGLALVDRIVRAHGAALGIRSITGSGTSVEITFPRLRGSPGTRPLSLACCVVAIACSGAPHERATALGATPAGDTSVVVRRLTRDSLRFGYWFLMRDGHTVVGTDTTLSTEPANVATLDVMTQTTTLLTSDARAGGGAEAVVVSRDERQIAYAWRDKSRGPASLRVMDAATRAERTIMNGGPGELLRPYQWSSDGHALLVGRQTAERGFEFLLLDVHSGATHVITSIGVRRPDDALGAGATISPDGRWVAFDAQSLRQPQGREICIVALDGSRMSTVVDYGSHDVVLSWSEDGKWLLFARQELRSSGIHRIPVAGGRATGPSEIVRGDIVGLRRFVQSNGGRIAYLVMNRTGGLKVLNVDLEKKRVAGEPRSLIRGGLVPSPEWSPDGQYVAMGRRFERYPSSVAIVDLESGDVLEVPAPADNESVRSWSPDGKSLLLRGERHGTIVVHRMDLATGTFVEEGRYQSALDVPITSPDGSVELIQRRAQGRNTNLLLRNPTDGTERKLLGPSFMAPPVVSPDGQIVATVEYTEEARLLMIPVDGGDPLEIMRVPIPFGDPAISIGSNSLGWSGDSRYLTFRITPFTEPRARRFHKDEVWIAERNGKAWKLFTYQAIGATRLSPDGKLLLFNGTDEPVRWEVWVIDNPAGTK